MIFTEVGRADPLDTWVSRSALLPTNTTLFAMAYGNGQFVAVGAGYNQVECPILTSADGVDWALQQSRTTNASLNCIAYNLNEPQLRKRHSSQRGRPQGC